MIDTEHLHFWMQAIRNSPDPTRTLDAFWAGQIKSKEWLIENLRTFVAKESSIEIHGGWVGVLASMIFQSGIPVSRITSVDLDDSCQPIASMMNKKEEIEGRFNALTADMCDIIPDADIIINTSCEHISQTQYESWVSKISSSQLIVLQSNNYEIPEHVRIAESLQDFKKQSKIEVIWEGQLSLPLYDRYMLICRNS
jgi:hypothetical protein